MTRGQFGSATESVRSDATYTVLSLGGQFEASERVSFGADVSYTTADESMDRISMAFPPEILAILVDSTYDLTHVHTYSDLDSGQWNATVRAEAKVAKDLVGVASYSYFDFDDNEPYLENLSGNLDLIHVGLRWSF